MYLYVSNCDSWRDKLEQKKIEKNNLTSKRFCHKLKKFWNLLFSEFWYLYGFLRLKWCMSMYVWRIWMYPYLFVKSIYMATVWHYRFHHYVEISHQFNSARYKGINVKVKVRQWLKGLKSSISQWNQLNCTLWFLTNQINTNKKVKQMRNILHTKILFQLSFLSTTSSFPQRSHML